MSPTSSSLVQAAVAATSPATAKMEQDSALTAKKISETVEDITAIARTLLESACPSLLTVLDAHTDKKSAEDRLIKIGRNAFSSVLRYGANGTNADATKLEAALTLLTEEANQLATILEGKTTLKVPTVRFGKTELQMPIVTLGCMRFQQSWNRGKADTVLDISQVKDDCQENLVEILRYAYQCGVRHIETAKGYGSSQLQLGFALKQLFDSGEIKREDLIIQTKLPVGSTPAAYRDQILASIKLLQLDYIDLFGVHGVNFQSDYDTLFDNPKGNSCEALTELKQKGKIRHVGFSTHGPAKFIRKVIETDFFDYINLHYQWCGSYTASGDLEDAGNLANVRLAHEKDMGIFIISVYDKGGKLYMPSNKLRDLCLPDMEPMTYGSVWLWQHEMFDAQKAPAHTFTVGAARPSDLDQPIISALALAGEKSTANDLAERRERVTTRLNQAMVDALGQEWMDTWNKGLLNAHDSKYQTHHTGLVWCYNLIKGWGMIDFAKDRYGPMENFLKNWSADKTKEENMKKLGGGFGWMPGVAVTSSLDYTPDFVNCPDENKERLMEAIHFVHEWASKPAEGQESKKVPDEWEAAFDMRPWTAFPER